MDLRVVGFVMLLVGLSFQDECDQCDCIISGSNGESGGVFNSILTCQEGSVTWYNPTGALRLELKPDRLRHFKTCFVVESGLSNLKISREVNLNINSKSPIARSTYELNDHNLKTLMASEGTSPEYCMTSEEPIILYLEPEVTGTLGYQKIVFRYDSAPVTEHPDSSIEDCRPCSEAEILKAYCSSDYVIVASMETVEHQDHVDKTKIEVAVSQLIRQKGSHFVRTRRDSPTLEGTISAPRKCGIVRGDGTFLMTGRVRLGELKFGCSPYLDEWEKMVNRAEMEGRMECSRD